MFIHCKAARAFKHPLTKERHVIPMGHIGEVPDWVTQTAYFAQNCADGTITALVSTKDAAVDQALTAADVKAAATAQVAEQKREADGQLAMAPQPSNTSRQVEAKPQIVKPELPPAAPARPAPANPAAAKKTATVKKTAAKK